MRDLHGRGVCAVPNSFGYNRHLSYNVGCPIIARYKFSLQNYISTLNSKSCKQFYLLTEPFGPEGSHGRFPFQVVQERRPFQKDDMFRF